MLGYMPFGNAAMLLLCLRSRPSVTLPGGHVVHTVMESKWIHIPLQAGTHPGMAPACRLRHQRLWAPSS